MSRCRPFAGAQTQESAMHPTPAPRRARQARLAPLPARLAAAAGSLIAAGALWLAAQPAAAAGPVEVVYTAPEQFTDAGRSVIDRERNLAALTQHLQALGQRLPDGQALRVEVLDVDLAGEVWPSSIHELRVMRGGVDWPRITVQYTLLEGSRTVAEGRERISDNSYLLTRGVALDHGALPYERRMLEQWFRQRFEPAAAGR
jgi:hypothetical protein